MADWRHLTTLDIADELSHVIDEFQKRDEANSHHHGHEQGGAEDQAKWTLVGIVVAIVVMVVVIKLSNK